MVLEHRLFHFRRPYSGWCHGEVIHGRWFSRSDTLRVRDGSRIRTVRLACINAPETNQAPQGARACRAARALAP